MDSGAPFVISSVLVRLRATSTERRRRSKSKGTLGDAAPAVRTHRCCAARMASSSGLRTPAWKALFSAREVRARGRCSRPCGSTCAASVIFASRQRAGLVDAQHVHGAEIVDRRQPLHDDLALRHAQRAARQRHRHHHRQQFGRQADRERDREQEGLHRGPVRDQMRQQHEQHEKHRQPQDQKAEPPHALLESGRRRIGGQRRGDRAEAGAAAGLHDQHRAAAADGTGAGEQGVGRVRRQRSPRRARRS